MAMAYERDQIGQKQEIANIVTNIVSEQTPMTSRIKKEPQPKQKLMEYQVETYPDVALSGVMDGQDVEQFESTPREMLHAVQQKFRQPWQVSDFSDVTEVAGLPKGERGRQRAVALTLLAFALEGRLLSNAESSYDNGADAPNETRGAFKWLQTAAQTHLPVPENFRPSATIFSGALDTLTEDQCEELISAAWEDRRTSTAFFGVVGRKLKKHFDSWSVYTADKASHTQVRQFNNEQASKKVINCVDFLEFSTGTVQLHLSAYLYLDEATGAKTDFTTRSGMFLDMSKWALRYMRKPRMRDLEDRGGGPRGFSDTIGGLCCLNPLGQPAMHISADS